MGWRSTALIVILAFSILFSLLYIAPLAVSTPFSETNNNPTTIIPTQPRISQLDALEDYLKEAKMYHHNTTDIGLWVSFYNYSEAYYNKHPEHYRGYQWSLVHDIRKHPTLLDLPLYYFHPNGTEYRIFYKSGKIVIPIHGVNGGFHLNGYCTENQDGGVSHRNNNNINDNNIGEQTCITAVYQSATGRLVYAIDAEEIPRSIPSPMLIDAETGKVVYDYYALKPTPPSVQFYDNKYNPPKTVKEILEKKAKFTSNNNN